MSRLDKVREFMEMNGQEIEKLPNGHILNKIKLLRSKLINEELEELEEAISNNDIVEIADALVDLEYVLLGTVHAFGLTDKFNLIFNAVHENNMSKLCNSHREAIDTAEHYATQKNISTYLEEQKEGKWAVKRTSDGKLLKSLLYKKVNLTPFFDEKHNRPSYFGN